MKIIKNFNRDVRIICSKNEFAKVGQLWTSFKEKNRLPTAHLSNNNDIYKIRIFNADYNKVKLHFMADC